MQKGTIVPAAGRAELGLQQSPSPTAEGWGLRWGDTLLWIQWHPPFTSQGQSGLPLKALSPLCFVAQHQWQVFPAQLLKSGGNFSSDLSASLKQVPQRVNLQNRGTCLAETPKQCMCWDWRDAVTTPKVFLYVAQSRNYCTQWHRPDTDGQHQRYSTQHSASPENTTVCPTDLPKGRTFWKD